MTSGEQNVLQMLSQEEQEQRGKNLTSVSGWVVQDCLTQNTAAGPQWVWSKTQTIPWPVVREYANVFHNLFGFMNAFLIPSYRAFIMSSFAVFTVYFSPK